MEVHLDKISNILKQDFVPKRVGITVVQFRNKLGVKILSFQEEDRVSCLHRGAWVFFFSAKAVCGMWVPEK
jgi:hypothetical protein